MESHQPRLYLEDGMKKVGVILFLAVLYLGAPKLFYSVMESTFERVDFAGAVTK